MGDKLVNAICTVFRDVAFANRCEMSALRPLVDAVVNKLRESGMTDDDIARRFGRADYLA